MMSPLIIGRRMATSWLGRSALSAVDRLVLAELQNISLRVLSRAFADRYRSAVLLDFPAHQNAGDAMIWLGERRYLRDLGIHVRYTSSITAFSRHRYDKARRGAVALLSGGGNLGDLYPRHQLFREALVEQSPDSPVVILPQSIYFQSRENAARANKVFGAHGDVTILCRDRVSMERARAQLPAARIDFCPDMALGIGPITRTRLPTHDYVLLVRTDGERIDDDTTSLANAFGPTDWHLAALPRRSRVACLPLSRRFLGLYRKVPQALSPPFRALLSAGYKALAENHVAAARSTLSTGKVLVTDRLHAHILATLMGIPNVVRDNKSGKIAAAFHDYTYRFTSANLAATVREQQEIAERLLGGSVSRQ